MRTKTKEEEEEEKTSVMELNFHTENPGDSLSSSYLYMSFVSIMMRSYCLEIVIRIGKFLELDHTDDLLKWITCLII